MSIADTPAADPMLIALIAWREDLARAAEARGHAMFMFLPDAWFDDPHWFCAQGHVRRTYLRSDSGARCMACQGEAVLGPAMSEADFSQVIGGLALKVASDVIGGDL